MEVSTIDSDVISAIHSFLNAEKSVPPVKTNLDEGLII